MTITLNPYPLTTERFAPYGDVIEASPRRRRATNAARFDRFDDLCTVDIADGGRTSVSIARCRTATALPYQFDVVERYPLGSLAIVPLMPCRMIVVVAAPGESVDANDLHAFVTNGRQGINYRRGIWHMPLIAFDAGLEFLVIERSSDEPDCEEHCLDEAIRLVSA